MSLLRTILAITLLVMVTFNMIDYLNIIHAKNDVSYKAYYLIQRSLNVDTKKKNSSKIQSKHSNIITMVNRNQSKFKISLNGQVTSLDFNERIFNE